MLDDLLHHQALNAPLPRLRMSAIRELILCSKTSESKTTILHLLGEVASSDVDRWNRAEALKLLSTIEPPMTEEAFQRLFQKMAASTATYPLSFSGSFVVALEDEYSIVRLECLKAISTISEKLLKSNPFLPFLPSLFLCLIDLLEDESPLVREESLSVMRCLLPLFQGRNIPSSTMEIFFDSLSRLSLLNALDIATILLIGQQEGPPVSFIDFLLSRAMSSIPKKSPLLSDVLLFLRKTSHFLVKEAMEKYSSSPFYSLLIGQGDVDVELMIMYPSLINHSVVMDDNHVLIGKIKDFLKGGALNNFDDFCLLRQQLKYCSGDLYFLLDDIICHHHSKRNDDTETKVSEFPFSKYKGISNELAEWIKDPTKEYQLRDDVEGIEAVKVKITSLKKVASFDDVYQLLIEGIHNGVSKLEVWIDASLAVAECPSGNFSIEPILMGKGVLLEIKTKGPYGATLLSLPIP